MPQNRSTIARHIFSVFGTIVLTILFSCASIYVSLVIKYGSFPDGPYADMAGVGFGIFFCGFLFLLFLLLVVIGFVSEFGKKIFQGKLNQWVSTPLMFVFYTGISLLILFLLETFIVHDRYSIYWWFPPVFGTSLKIGSVGVIYWLIFTIPSPKNK